MTYTARGNTVWKSEDGSTVSHWLVWLYPAYQDTD